MVVKLKVPQRKGRTGKRSGISATRIKLLVGMFVVLCMAVLCTFSYFYLKYEKIIDRRMSGPIFANSAKIYALPHTVHVGEQISAAEIVGELRRAGYSEMVKEQASQVGTYRLTSEGVEIHPGTESYHSQDACLIQLSNGAVERIAANGNQDVVAYELEPQLVTDLFQGETRSKRQVVKYQDIPKVMVDAVLAIEDRRFFQHAGVNYLRLAEAAWVDMRDRKHSQGGSTITMQMARAFFLTPEKTYKRKVVEMLIAYELEQKFTKQQIFELYANRVDMGQRGSFTIQGFAEAAHAYFNKDLQSLTLPEAALLAGLIQAPSYLSPYRHPERAMERRNLVLDSMVDTGAITRDQAEKAKATPLKLAPMNVEASEAPYFVDLVKDTLSSRYSEHDLNDQAMRIYTTLDPDLQRAAAEAVEEGMKLVDEQVTRLRTRTTRIGKGKNAITETKVLPGPQAQVAMVVLDPHTGDVLALVGGRNYGLSQLNHAVSAKRPTGSIFKPFVYATAMNTGLDGDAQAETPVSLLDDSPGTYAYGDQIYEPRNYKSEYHGQVTARYALALSLNNATVKLAQEVGYDKVAELARAAGIASVKATPAMALGAYDATPLEMAAAYTVFANGGTRVSPIAVKSVRSSQGDVIEDFTTDSKPVLDPRVAYIMTNMMEGVLNFGTGYEVRKRGVTAPAAGKTGSSHDAWFAGYTSNLLCVVWVGYDDYSDLRLSGGVTAAPIWAEFMKRALKLPSYRDTKPFLQPPGVVDVQLDKTTNLLATPACPETYTVAFIAGTEPKDTCEQGLGDHRNLLQKLFGGGQPPAVPPAPAPAGKPQTGRRPLVAGGPPLQPGQSPSPDQEAPRKKGFFGKILGVFKGDNDSQQQHSSPEKPPQ